MRSLLFAAPLSVLIAACAVAPETQQTSAAVEATALQDLAELPSSEAKPFDPSLARAFMETISTDGALDAAPVYASDGSALALLINGGIQVVSAETGQRLEGWSPEELAALNPSVEDEPSITLETDPFGARVAFEAAAHRIPFLSENAEPIPVDRIEAPRMVRSMFPMNGYDRRENLSPDGAWFASLDGPDLAIRRPGSDVVTKLTAETLDGRQWFHGNDIWESSASIWSQDSDRFVARLHDTQDTPPIDLIDYLGDGDEHQTWTYWSRAGDPLPRTELHVVSPETGEITQLNPVGTTDDHLFFIEWSPDGREVLAIRYSRDLSRQDIFAIDASSGTARTIWSRQVTSGWVKWPSGPQTIRHLPAGGYLLRSDHEGIFNYYRLDRSGAIEAKITDAPSDVGDVIGIGPDNATLYYHSATTVEAPYDQVPHKVSLDGAGEARALSKQPGVHRSTLSPDGQTIVTVHSAHDRPSRADLLTTEGEIIATIAPTEAPAETDRLFLTERFTALAADGETVMHGTLFKPSDFDPSKTYPVIHRVYGAMQSRTLSGGYLPERVGRPGSEYNGMLPYLADAGFIVVTMDAPGSPGRGRDFNLAYWGNWPGAMPDDYAAGLSQLAETRPWIDRNRIGIDGNSWGGYVALYTALERPDIYRSVSISVPETDLKDHVHWIEWQIGKPENNPGAYANGNLADRADELQADLLIVAGTSDVNVPISNTMKLLDGLAEAGQPYELVLFPGTNHAHQGRGDRYAYAVERIRQFHTKHLQAIQ